MDTEPKPTVPDLDKVELILPPKKKRVPKRFTSKEQIERQIDKFTRKAKRQRDEQRKLYADASLLTRRRTDCVDAISQAAKKEADGDRLGRKADRLEKDVLPKLKAKLAEFQTDPIPGIMDDRSVPGI